MRIKHVLLSIALGTAGIANAGNLIVNGGFDSGLSGWQTFTTSNGMTGGPSTVSFDTTGLGSSSASQFYVGQISFTPGIYEGGGIFQSFSVLSEGTYDFYADVAAYNKGIDTNAAGGRFSIFVDSTELATWDSGVIAGNQIERASLFGSQVLTTGNHTLRILIDRPFKTHTYQYIDNISIAAVTAPVPEPETYAMMLAGLGLLGFVVRRRKQALPA